MKEIKSLFWISLYFFVWFMALMLLKDLLLHEYKLEFYGASMALVGALVAAKSVLLLENIPLTGRKSPPAIVVAIFGAVFFFNLGSVVKAYLGEGGLLRVLRTPVPEKQ